MRKRQREVPVGQGWYRYKNITGADLLLSKPLINGRMMVPRGGTFEADSFYEGDSGVHIIENLCHYLRDKAPAGHLLDSGKVKRPEQSPSELITDSVNASSLEFFESDGTPINEAKSASPREKGEVDLTKKELVDFAELKGLQINANWTKEKILNAIREVKN